METPTLTTSWRDRSLALLYAATILTSAFLLFQVQPLVSKRILPWFGGSPAVWTTCLMFFQAVLFAGYAYAHFSERWFRPRRQAVVHFGLLLAAVTLLRLLPDASWEPTGQSSPVGQILLILVVSVGLPFFVLSATAPLVQVWFARSFRGRPPYRLYALSNFGSLLALLSYPLIFEREFDLSEQARYWSWGFIAFTTVCGFAALQLWNGDAKEGAAPAEPMAETNDELAQPSYPQFALWLLLPAFASVTLLATTNHVCTDVAVVPFLWVVPLALYLVTFIIAFDHPRWFRPTLIAAVTLVAIYGAAMVAHNGIGEIDLYDCASTGRLSRLVHQALISSTAGASDAAAKSPQFEISFRQFLALNLAAMFGICLLCHGELARQRPHPRYLTSYYLTLAAGGALGGAAVTLLAPQVFKTYFEWRIAMFVGAIAAVAQLLYAALNRGESISPPGRSFMRAKTVTLVVLLVPTMLVLVDLAEYLKSSNVGVVYRERDFFGTFVIRERNADDATARQFVLQHGITTHGTQFTDSSRRGIPTSYYSTPSGVGRTLNYFRELPDLGSLKIGAVGLGTGTLAAYVGQGDSIRFYDINPAVVEIAASGRWFTYLSDCLARGGRFDIKLGDARLSLQRELRDADSPKYHVLVLDAFSGDAVPAHLLTEEAFAIYLEHIASADEDGVEGALAVHISNRYLDLEPVVRGAAEHFGLQSLLIHNSRNPAVSVYSADWVILTNNEPLLAALAPHAAPVSERQQPAILWTDARSNLFDVLK